MNNKSENIFVFVVCGKQVHIDTLHYSLAALKSRTRNKIVVVTDSSRNEVPVQHPAIIDVSTPHHLTHHQASIYLKTGLFQFLPSNNNYCYLDTDVVALDEQVDKIFTHFQSPVTFAADHCVIDQFSPSAVKCGCDIQFTKWQAELQQLFTKYRHLIHVPENEQKKTLLLQHFEEIKKNKLSYAWMAIKFRLSPRKFYLHNDAILDKERHAWVDKNDNVILYEREDDFVTAIESSSAFRGDKKNIDYWTINGQNVFDCRCNHLQQQITDTFGITVADKKWQHWNGGVFLFNSSSYQFLESWHKKTMHIFENKRWQTRDQGTLIATVWEHHLQNAPLLPQEFNLIADYHNKEIHHTGKLKFMIGEHQKEIAPHFIHVYHHWGDENWDVWQQIEKRTGICL